MRYLLDNKIYDTEKSKLIITYRKSIEHKGLFFTTYPRYKHTLYKTKKGNFFVHVGSCCEEDIAYSDYDYIKLISGEEVKEILNKLNAIDKYEELFGKIKEG